MRKKQPISVIEVAKLLPIIWPK